MSLSVDVTQDWNGFRLHAAFDAPPGVTALFGRSGAGKSSVVNAVAGLLTPQAGRISVAGQVIFDAAGGVNLPVHRRGLGYVFQDARLFPHLSVQKNLTYGQRFSANRGPAPGLAEICDLLDIHTLLARYPTALSGGETQRVAIGRALLAAPRLLLLDEPLAALDATRKAEILPYLERLRDDLSLPMLYVSHSVAEIARLADTVILLDQGQVVRAGPTGDILSDPAMVRQLGIRSAGAVLSARIEAHHPDGLSELSVSGGRLLLPRADLEVGHRTRVRVLAQDVMLATHRPEGLSALNILPVTVTHLRDGDGPGVICQLSCGADRLLARVTRRSADSLNLQPGKPVFAVLKAVSIDPVDIGRG